MLVKESLILCFRIGKNLEFLYKLLLCIGKLVVCGSCGIDLCFACIGKFNFTDYRDKIVNSFRCRFVSLMLVKESLILCFRIGKNLEVLYKLLLCIGELIISSSCGINLSFALVGKFNLSDSIDKVFNILYKYAVCKLYCEEIARVILVVNSSFAVANKAGNAVLRMRRSVNLGCGHSFRSLVNLNRGNATRVIIISGIEINLSGGFFVCGRKKHRALRVALHRNACRNLKSACINHHYTIRSGEVVLCNSEIHIAIVNNRGAGAHKTIFGVVFASEIIQLAVFVEFCAVKIACFGGEVYFSVCVCNRGTLITHDFVRIKQFAGELVAGKYLCGAGAAGTAVVSTVNHIVADHNGACPVESAFNNIAPKSLLRFSGVFSVFVCNRNADISRIFGFTVPESGINITIGISYRRKCLTFKRVAINPKRFKCFCIKCLNCTVMQRSKNHTVGVCCRSIAPVN